MKAIVLDGPAALALSDVPEPRPGPGEALVRVERIGLCGTDVKLFTGAIPIDYPRVLGHEIVGRIVEAPADTVLRTGDRVVLDPNTSCGVCFHCRVGQEHLCPGGQLIGRDRDGGLAELVVAPAGNCHLLPPEIADNVGPVIQVFATVIHAHRRVEIFPGQAVAVIGLGVTGQLHVQMARLRGAHPVIGITRSATKRSLAEELGADITLPADGNAAAALREATEGRGADLVIEAVGSPASVALAVDLARIGGTLLGFGIGTGHADQVRLYELYFKELAWISSRATKGEDFAAGIDYARRGVVRLDPLVSRTVPFEDTPVALREFAEAGNVMKLVVAVD
jgi:L-iditol 2-dehydrogenase